MGAAVIIGIILGLLGAGWVYMVSTGAVAPIGVGLKVGWGTLFAILVAIVVVLWLVMASLNKNRKAT